MVRAHASHAEGLLDALTERSLTVYQAANGYPVGTLGR